MFESHSIAILHPGVSKIILNYEDMSGYISTRTVLYCTVLSSSSYLWVHCFVLVVDVM
jgi:hypothetical protein